MGNNRIPGEFEDVYSSPRNVPQHGRGNDFNSRPAARRSFDEREFVENTGTHGARDIYLGQGVVNPGYRSAPQRNTMPSASADFRDRQVPRDTQDYKNRQVPMQDVYSNEVQRTRRTLPEERGKGAKKSKKQQNGEEKPKLPSWKKALRAGIALLLVILLIGGCTLAVVNTYFNQTKLDDGDLGISALLGEKYGNTKIVNVAVFGIDTRDENSFEGRSDGIIIASIDRKNNTVKLTSVLRDSYVAIEGYKNQKITHAYMFGGAPLAIKTLNQNFDLNISDYVTVNFYKLGDAINQIGGIDIEITEAERVETNTIANSEGKVVEHIQSAGFVHLNGEQAATYCRIRAIDSDNARSDRQKKVVLALLETIKKMPATEYPDALKSIMSLVETSLSYKEIMSFAPMLLKDIKIGNNVIPGEAEKPIGGIYDGHWVWRYDLDAAATRLHEYIYESEIEEDTTANNE